MNTKEVLSNTATNVLTVFGSFSNDNAIALLSATLAPVAVAITTDFASRVLSSIQSTRLNNTFQFIFEKCNIRKNNGETFRKDAFMTQNDGQQAKQVLEGILQNIRDEYEIKKLEYHANQFVNVCYDERIIFEQAVYVSRLFGQLTYR